tara:strand:+ start:141 stop:653 length:513 start_codon:yes stop_codon:yes gene_type:complete
MGHLRKNKKGISVMIGYIFLITIAILISTVVYQQMKTYVPSEGIECSDGVSVFVKEIVYNCEDETLKLVLKNNGRFGIAGYFIKGTNSSEDEIATIDLSNHTSLGLGGAVIINRIGKNTINPGSKITSFFELSESGINKIYFLEISPMRYEEKRVVNCGSSKIKEALTCS